MVIHQTQPYSYFYTSRSIIINPHKIIKIKCYTQHTILDVPVENKKDKLGTSVTLPM